ncbi:MAG: hypothetical protein ACI89X_000570 [Planctomycetota bacterium]|jgi:hypothetical protein
MGLLAGSGSVRAMLGRSEAEVEVGTVPQAPIKMRKISR